MRFEKAPNGNLVILADPEDREMLEDLKLRNGADDNSFMADLLEETGWGPNARLLQLSPSDIGALTDAPILTDYRDISDAGTCIEVGQVWWYPNYMVRNFADDLLESGKTVFQLAPAG